MKVAFLLSKDPATTHGGDLTISRELMAISRSAHETVGLCLSPDVTSTRQDGDLWKVPKPSVAPASIALRSLRRGRSLVHTRFDDDAYVAALDAIEADVYIADHSYMAEPFLRSRWSGARPLLVNTVISESLVWSETRGMVGRVDSIRIRRDELRVARAAHGVGTYDADEAAYYRAHGVPRARWLDVTLAPKPAVDVAASGRRLVFVGERAWPPNQQAFETLLQWWPDISRGIDDAELCVVGNRVRTQPLPDGVRDLGFVPDLDAFLGSCRAVLAPVTTGGGVRVKILDAASRGLPVVATSAAVGSLSSVFDIPADDEREDFVAAARAMLLDRDAAAAEGARIYAVNADRWAAEVPQRTILDWIES
ncbi:glycosyltransferase [Aeromicrobium sp. NPDC092404]|uniref:glycosyltransferase n=1 Tax=Aeromicrobium sp. NPDC092404 TaxID=3154976 RepID=UPI00342B7880